MAVCRVIVINGVRQVGLRSIRLRPTPREVVWKETKEDPFRCEFGLLNGQQRPDFDQNKNEKAN